MRLNNKYTISAGYNDSFIILMVSLISLINIIVIAILLKLLPQILEQPVMQYSNYIEKVSVRLGNQNSNM